MRRSVRTTSIALVAASLLALLEMFRHAVTGILEGHSTPPGALALRVFPMWITIVAASPWCALMAWWFPFRSGRTLRTLAAHLAGAAVFVAIHLGLLLGIHAILAAFHGGHLALRINGETIRLFPTGGHELVHLYVFYTAMEMSVYASIVLVLLLLEARREAGERALASARLTESVTRARLESLRAQIRPHFLFNTLNALAVLARRGDGTAVDRAIGDLGELLRASFESGDQDEIPLARELEFLERYVHLQRIRFPDRLDVAWEIADEARAALVPALLVQPLVENALEHGLTTARGGRVRVAAWRDADRLRIEVSDDGPGFTAAGDGTVDGVGLANTRERLQLLYDSRGTLSCDTLPGGGGRVRIELPWRTAAQPAEGA